MSEETEIIVPASPAMNVVTFVVALPRLAVATLGLGLYVLIFPGHPVAAGGSDDPVPVAHHLPSRAGGGRHDGLDALALRARLRRRCCGHWTVGRC